MGVTQDIEKHVDENIEKLKLEKNFRYVDWEKVKAEIDLTDLKARISMFENLNIKMNEKEAPAEEAA